GDVPCDTRVRTAEDRQQSGTALRTNGFFGPDSWYMNARANADYATAAVNDGALGMPVLFLHGEYDYTCETVASRLAEPMRQACKDLTEVIVKSGNWMGQEQPGGGKAALARVLAVRFPAFWAA